jgi:hypothetical protein
MRVIPLTVLIHGAGCELWRHEGFLAYEAQARAVERHLVNTKQACELIKERCEL